MNFVQQRRVINIFEQSVASLCPFGKALCQLVEVSIDIIGITKTATPSCIHIHAKGLYEEGGERIL